MNDNFIVIMNYSIPLTGMDQAAQTRLHGGKPTS